MNIDKVSNTYRYIPYICLQIKCKLLVSNHIQQLTHYYPIFIKLSTQNAFVRYLDLMVQNFGKYLSHILIKLINFELKKKIVDPFFIYANYRCE